MITFGYLHGEDSIEMWPIDSNVKKETANSDAQWTNGLSQGLSPREETLIDATIEAICSCFIGPETHEAVELQIIKVSSIFFSFFLLYFSILLFLFLIKYTYLIGSCSSSRNSNI